MDISFLVGHSKHLLTYSFNLAHCIYHMNPLRHIKCRVIFDCAWCFVFEFIAPSFFPSPVQ